MKAMILAETAPLEPGSNPLQPAELPAPEPGPGELLICYALEDANKARPALKFEPVKGAKVLRISP